METYFFLHGALQTQDQWTQVIKEIDSKSEDKYLTVNFSGHGKSDYQAPFSTELYMEDLDKVIKANIDSSVNKIKTLNEENKVHLIGYSLGGYVSLQYAFYNPNKVATVTTIGTKLLWNQDVLDKELSKLNPEIIKVKVPAFYEQLDKSQVIGATKILNGVAQLLTKIAEQSESFKSELSSLNIPIRMFRGSLDNSCTIEDINYGMEINKMIQYKEIEGMKHPLDSISPKELIEHLGL
jgi:pimeloyl-ACP methyl ester carboxylesterase